MMTLHALLFIVYAILNTAAMAAIKNAMAMFASHRMRALGWLGLGGVLYVGAIGLLLDLLKEGAASIAFPIAIGCTVVVTNIVGMRFYGEHLTPKKAIGTVLVLAGAVMTFLGGPST